jgi:DNA-binding transcriptional ArsR family regulator
MHGTANTEADDLDAVFAALANRHRREIVYVLGMHPCTIKQLAEMRGLSLPAIHKHIKLLEGAGLVTRRKLGRSNVLTLNRHSLRGLQDWLAQYHTYWGSEEETLENYAHYLGAAGPGDGRPDTKEHS